MFCNRVRLLSKLFSFIHFTNFPVVVLQKNLLQIETLFFIFLFQYFVLLFIVTDGLKKLGVGLFACQKLHNHFFDIWIASAGAHLLECLFSLSVMLHFSVHALLEIVRPGHLNVKSVAHLQLILIFTFILSSFSDLVLTESAVVSLLDGLFLVFDRGVQWLYSFLSFHVISIDVDHQVVQSVLRLQLLLSSLHQFCHLVVRDWLFGSQRLSQIIDSQSKWDKVSLHSIKHVVVTHLFHLLKVVSCR